ncbi:MAG: hypothetical protein ABIJ97_06450 [Bacteroidota bacterium]
MSGKKQTETGVKTEDTFAIFLNPETAYIRDTENRQLLMKTVNK